MDYTDIGDELLISLRRIIRAVSLHSRKLEKDFNLTGPQLFLLNEVAKQQRISIGELAKKASISQATATNIVQRLESRGYLKRDRKGNDKRMVFVESTELALTSLAKSPSLLQEKFAERLKKLKKWEQIQLLASLQRIAEMMDADELPVSSFMYPENSEDNEHE